MDIAIIECLLQTIRLIQSIELSEMTKIMADLGSKLTY
jgi:hypothetical protein